MGLKCAFLTRSRVMGMLLVPGPHSEPSYQRIRRGPPLTDARTSHPTSFSDFAHCILGPGASECPMLVP